MKTRLVFAAIGLACLARAGYLVQHTIKPSQWPEILTWFAVGIVAHDAVIAPVTLLLGRLVRRGLRSGPARSVLAAGWLGAGVVLLLGYPLVKGAQVRRNYTVIPDAPGREIITALLLVGAGMLLAGLVRPVLRRARRAAEPDHPAA